ncbi:PREDICTED: putative RING-H2 finger protein ATL21A [Nicotiana attenuata]|uniref:RING-type E3 ubiquitin transferase n=1 Tax=Nicotiana attenuata TaxID=49451 RepID=A0A1J6IRF4_NICAT|nr:PREDICTED: putative RING-H2 finger protein ATL21A [Nicotiana attenuata]OIT07422.1 ring-h2 finger protein atl20 [Nicotiana attenuata]
MGTLSLFFFLFLHHFALSSSTTYFSSNISICGNLTIRYPFQLQSQKHQDQNPGYNNCFFLRCTDQGNALLNIPYSGDFLVLEINYSTKEIKLQHPSNCLPRKLLHFHLPSSPISASSSQNYTFFLLSDFHGDLRLSWDVHLDKYRDSNMTTSGETTHLNVPRTDKTSRQEAILIIFVGVSLILPSLLCLICVTCRIFLELRHHRQVTAAAAAAAMARLAPMPMNVIAGLDESTVQSYPKVVFGESRHLPGINAITCSICLAEYSAGETLRCIPECEHCFHAECVDKWLKMNSTCPVCRNSLHS